MKTIRLLAAVLSLFTLVSFFISCQKQATTAVDQQDQPVKFMAKMAMDNAPAEVIAIKGTLSRDGYPTVTADFDIQADSAIADFGSVYAGPWHLAVTAYSDSNQALYFGETDIYINPGKENVVYLQLNPLTGALKVVVIWGGQDKGGYALDFDGDNSLLYVEHPDSAMDAISFAATFEAWIKPRSITSDARIVAREDDDYSDRILLALDDSTQGVHFRINRQRALGGSLPLNTWTHVAGTFDGQQIKVYINGQLKAQVDYDGYIDVRQSGLYIGNNILGNRQFDGAIDEVRIWSYARSAEQIQSTMNKKLYGNEPGLVAYWPMDEGRGQIVEDLAHGNSATLGKTTVENYDDPQWIPHTFGN